MQEPVIAYFACDGAGETAGHYFSIGWALSTSRNSLSGKEIGIVAVPTLREKKTSSDESHDLPPAFAPPDRRPESGFSKFCQVYL